MSNPNDPAFATFGLTKRELMAALIAVGLITDREIVSNAITGPETPNEKWISARAIRQADSLIANLNKENSSGE